MFDEYVESMPEDFRRETFERGLDTGWDGARKKMYQWRIRREPVAAGLSMTRI